MKLAVVGVTGLVGQEILEVLNERNFSFDTLIPAASERSVGRSIEYRGKSYPVVTAEEAIISRPDIAVFSAGSTASIELAPKFADAGSIVIDNSSAWRMSANHKLVVPEVNGEVLRIDDRIIANPNCSTIQLVMVLAPLHKKYGIKRVVVSTYQSVSGSGKKAVDQLMDERSGKPVDQVYPHPIDLNALPHIDVFDEEGNTREEMKIVMETQKILDDTSIGVTATTVRIPVMGGHSEAVNIEFHEEYDLKELRNLLAESPGLTIEDDPSNNVYPMPLNAYKKDDVFVGRMRRDQSQPKSLNLWIVADNLRKGAATNAVQIAEYLNEHSMVY